MYQVGSLLCAGAFFCVETEMSRPENILSFQGFVDVLSVLA
jgi:hypothetical protein